MPGKHEPPSKRSFYLSVATSTLRALILVALVGLGVLGLARLFPRNESLGITGPASPKASAASPRTTPPPRSSPAPKRKARVKGVVVLVLNGAGKTGLAAEVSSRLQDRGYHVLAPGNAPHTARTVIYYRADSRPEAELLRRTLFRPALLRPAPRSVPAQVEVEVVLGTDYVQATP